MKELSRPFNYNLNILFEVFLFYFLQLPSYNLLQIKEEDTLL